MYTIVFREGRNTTEKTHLSVQGKILAKLILAVRYVLDSSPCFLTKISQ